MSARDGRWLEAAGVVLVRQMPGSAKGVMFITLEDESGIANLVIWPQVFEQYRRVVLSAGMLAVRGRMQREGEVVDAPVDLSSELASVGRRDSAFPLPHGRGDELHHGSPSPDRRGLPKARNLVEPLSRDRHKLSYPEPETMPIRMPKPRDFR